MLFLLLLPTFQNKKTKPYTQVCVDTNKTNQNQPHPTKKSSTTYKNKVKVIVVRHVFSLPCLTNRWLGTRCEQPVFSSSAAHQPRGYTEQGKPSSYLFREKKKKSCNKYFFLKSIPVMN